jgi:hypothetical protein
MQALCWSLHTLQLLEDAAGSLARAVPQPTNSKAARVRERMGRFLSL